MLLRSYVEEIYKYIYIYIYKDFAFIALAHLGVVIGSVQIGQKTFQFITLFAILF